MCVCSLFALTGTTALAASGTTAGTGKAAQSVTVSENKVTDKQKKEAEDVIAFVKEKLEKGELESEEDIRDAIAEGEKKFHVRFSEDEKGKIVKIVKKVMDLGLDTDELAKQAEDLYEKFGDEILDKAGDELAGTVTEAVKEGVKDSVNDFFKDFGHNIKEFFGGIFQS